MSAGEGLPGNIQFPALQVGVVLGEAFPVGILRTHGAVEYLKALVELLRLVQQLHVGHFLVRIPRCPEEAAEQPRVAEQLRVRQRGHAGMEAAHAQSGHGPVPFIRQHIVVLFNVGDQVLDHDIREQGKVPGLAFILRLGHAVAHHDDHLFHFPVRQQPVGDPARVSLVDPAGFVLAVAVLQVQHRIRLRRVIGRRRPHQADFMLPGHGGVEIPPGHRAVFHALQVVPAFHIGHGHVHKVHRPAAAVSDGQVGAQHVRAVHLQEEIQESGSHVKGAFPGTVLHGGQREKGAEPVDDHLFGVLGDNPEVNFSVRQDLRPLDAVPAGFTEIRIKRNRYVQRPCLLHKISLLVLFLFALLLSEKGTDNNTLSLL